MFQVAATASVVLISGSSFVLCVRLLFCIVLALFRSPLLTTVVDGTVDANFDDNLDAFDVTFDATFDDGTFDMILLSIGASSVSSSLSLTESQELLSLSAVP